VIVSSRAIRAIDPQLKTGTRPAYFQIDDMGKARPLVKDSDPFARISDVLPDEPISSLKRRRVPAPVGNGLLPPIPIARAEAPTLERPPPSSNPRGSRPPKAHATEDLPSVIIAPEPPRSPTVRMQPLAPSLQANLSLSPNPRRSRPPGPIGGTGTERVRSSHRVLRPAIRSSTVFLLLAVSLLVFAIGIATLVFWGRAPSAPADTKTSNPSSETAPRTKLAPRTAARMASPAARHASR
jgi:hypothetical protein